ncbi:Hypothetical predicted protein [Mytilus galloprovincialis]|uniref:AAA+ ATPase domain-containing protein n=2 Tax=Mytilus galloprovincialis TaxID=29158 RepID=A0A8B6EPG5_MYTGA|nr:Hypothetical predicted protein [Mytilus galloprovincialis]
MEHPAVGFDDPTLIDPLDAILNDLANDLDGDPTTFQDLLQISRSELGPNNMANITTAMEYFRSIENNKVYDKLDLVDYLINVTDTLNYHTVMGTNRVSDQLSLYKERLLKHREALRTKGVDIDKNFVGRIDDIKKIEGVISGDFAHYDSVRGVCICGLGGMGKTSLANEVCYRLYKSNQRWKIIRIDLRERDTLLDLLSLTLTELHETFSSTDIPEMIKKLWKIIPDIKRRTVLLFDNIDGLLQNRKGRQQISPVLKFFNDFLQMLDDTTIRILITSRQKLIAIDDKQFIDKMRQIGKSQKRMDELVLEIELKPLNVKEATELYEKCVDKQYKTDRKITGDIIRYCGYCPLAIRATCSAVNGGLLEPQVIRYNLKIAAEKGGLSHALQVNNCLAQTFSSLDVEYQKKLARLTVFQTAKFDVHAASAVFGELYMTMRPKMDLLALKTRHFVEITEPEEYMMKNKTTSATADIFLSHKLRYSLHPLVYMFLKELTKDGCFQEEVKMAWQGFVRHFEKAVQDIGEKMDTNCMKAWRMIEENKKHFISLFKGDHVQDTETTIDMKDRILLCTQMVLVGNLLLGDFHRINRIEKMLESSKQRNCKLEYLFWKIEKASFFFDVDRNELVQKYLKEIETSCDVVTAKGTALAPVFGIYFLLKGKFNIRRKQLKNAVQDLTMAQKLFNEHKFVRHRYMYHITNIYEKIGQAYLMLDPPSIEEARVNLYAAFEKAAEKVENFYNLDIPSFIASIGRLWYVIGLKENKLKNTKEAKEFFEKSVRYYTKAMALDTQMNLHKYDNYADKLVKRAESYDELGLLKVSGALSDAVKDIKEADNIRRKILQPPHYKCTHTPHLVGKILLHKAQQEYEKKQKGNAINHLWEGIMFYEITRDMTKCGGLHPIHIHRQEYEEIIAEHLSALQQARETQKIEPAIKFYNDFEKGKFEEDRQKARSERETIKHSEYVPIEDVKAEIMMAGPGNMTFTPVRADDSDTVSEEENFEMVEFKEVVFEDYKLKDDEVMDFDKLFERMENPDDFSTSEEEDVAMETEAKVIEGKGFESLMEIQEDIDQNSAKSAKTDLTIKEDEVFDEKEESGKKYLSEIQQKSSERSSISSASSHDMSSKEKRERFKRKRSRDPSMQAFLDSVERETSEKGKAVLKSTRSTSQDKSFDLEMPVLEYLSIVDTKDKEEKRKLLEDMKQRYPSVQEEEKEETTRESEDTEQQKVTMTVGRKRQLQLSRSEEVSRQKSSRDVKK